MRKKHQKYDYLENLDEETILRELAKLDEEENGKKKKKIDKDVFAVLAFLGVILVMAVLTALFRTPTENPEVANMFKDIVPDKKNRERLGVILTCGFLGVFLIVLYILKRIRDRKREAKRRREQLEKIKKVKELERARQRVQDAKRQAFLDAGKSEIAKRKKDEQLLKYHNYHNYEGYVRRDLNLYKDEDYEEEEEFEEEEGVFARIIRRISGFFEGIKEKFFDR